MSIKNLFTMSMDDMTYEWLIRLLEDLQDSTGLTESPWIELKGKRTKLNVAEAIGALANAEGGIVVVGVRDAKELPRATPRERIVGVSTREYEGIVNSLHAYLRDAMPEVHSIRLPEEEDAVAVVLRTNADAVIHPVVVSGRVKVRIGTSTVDADRNVVRDLVDRGRNGSESRVMPVMNIQSPDMLALWPDVVVPRLAVGVATSMLLTGAAAHVPSIGSHAIGAGLESLQASVLPDSLWIVGPMFEHVYRELSGWELHSRRSNDCQYRVLPSARGTFPLGSFGATALLKRDSRNLSCFIASWCVDDPSTPKLELQDLRNLLIGLIAACHDLTASLAEAISPGAPNQFGSWSGWIKTWSTELSLYDVIELERWRRVGAGYGGTHPLPAWVMTNYGQDSIQAVVNGWLNTVLANIGVIDHEAFIEKCVPPYWLDHLNRPIPKSSSEALESGSE